MKKQMLSLLLSLVLLLQLLSPLSALAEDRVSSGPCGENATWSLDRGTGVLSFEGTGSLYDAGTLIGYGDPLERYSALWWPQSESIREIRFGDGITGIGSELFSVLIFASTMEITQIRNVRTLRVPENIERIGGDAFYSLSRLDEIAILNPQCRIEEGTRTLGTPGTTVVTGYTGSTAQRYAEAHGYTFRAISCADGVHVYRDTVITPPTCDREGVMESECMLCHHKLRSAIPAAHDYVLTEFVGRTVYTCTRCGSSYVAGTAKRLKLEKYQKFDVAAEACLSVCFTPEKTDYYEFDVQWGSAGSSDYFIPMGSIYGSAGQLLWENACAAVLEAGKTYYYSYHEPFNETEPVWATVKQRHQFELVSTTATCTEAGTAIYACSYCGLSYADNAHALSHDYSEEILVPRTCTTDGLARYTCLRCGDTFVDVLPKYHNYEYDYYMPWYIHGVCADCGEVYTEGTPEPPLLTLGKTETVRFTQDQGTFFFRISPDQTERYAIVTGTDEATLWMYGAESIDWVEDEERDQIRMTMIAQAGETYYLEVDESGRGKESASLTLELEHDYRVTESVPATCTEAGSRSLVCNYCGKTSTEVEPPAHNWEYDVELPWYQSGVCTVCGQKIETGTKTPPALTLGAEVTPQPGEDGWAYYSFTPDKTDIYVLRVAEARGIMLTGFRADGLRYDWDTDTLWDILGAGETVVFGVSDPYGKGSLPPVVLEQRHGYEYVVAEEATCTQEGKVVGMCVYCGDYMTDTIPPAHDPEFDVSLPWYRHGVCKICGAEVEEGTMTPPEIRTGQTVEAQIAEPYDQAFYRFRPEKDGFYRFSLPNPGGTFTAWTSDGNGFFGQRHWESDGSFWFEGLVLAGETYYIGLGIEYDGVGTVPFSIEYSDGVKISELRLDQNQQVHLEGEERPVLYRFTAPESGCYEFWSEDLPAVPLGIFPVDAAAGEGISYFDFSDGSALSISCELEAGETCMLWVERQYESDTPNDFTLGVRRTDSLFEPKLLRLDRQETVKVPNSGNLVMYSFTPSVTGYYEFLSSAASNVDPYCVLFDEELNDLFYTDDTQNSLNFDLQAELEAGKTYYFGVGTYGGGERFPVLLREMTPWSYPNYVWNGFGSVQATVYHQDNPSVRVEETVYTTRILVKEPSYEEAGEAVYIAAFQNPMFSTQIRVETIPMLTGASLPCDGIICPGGRFDDMPPKEHWAHDAIDWAVVNGVTTGTSGDRFSPDAGCTRAQVATFLWRAAGCPAPKDGANPFTDVEPDAYYYDAVLWAFGEGITTGTSANKFSPDSVCTRAQ
ncbi:MAG: S-layer homology domain-containing protein, partial [Oscillospiraceae bacterium]|nr:S-layer homology domain-containing protein [Oscillospiraceae bacterium]